MLIQFAFTIQFIGIMTYTDVRRGRVGGIKKREALKRFLFHTAQQLPRLRFALFKSYLPFYKVYHTKHMRLSSSLTLLYLSLKMPQFNTPQGDFWFFNCNRKIYKLQELFLKTCCHTKRMCDVKVVFMNEENILLGGYTVEQVHSMVVQ